MESTRLEHYWAFLFQLSKVSKRGKLIALASALGISLFGILAKYLRRKQFRKDIRRCVSPSSSSNRYINRQGSGSVSLSSDRNSVASNRSSSSTITNLTPQQLGMEALETAINYWEDAIHATIPPRGKQLAISDSEKNSFNHLLEKILERSYNLQHICESLFLHQNSIIFRDDASVSSINDRFIEDRRTIASMSSIESFVSAQTEVADLRDFDEFWDVNHDASRLEFYTSSMKQLEENGIPYRSIRTDIAGCQSDVEYLSKLNCIRLAFQLLFKDEAVKKYFINCGKELLTYVGEDNNWLKIEEELRGRGVKCMTFYDIVLDFIILDAFDDLDSPPSSVTSVVQNRWLSNGFKEIALGTAVWSVLKAKRQLLKVYLSPVLAWGFLGPESDLKDICYYFKEQVVGFLHDIFNFHKVRYSSVEDLAEDVLSSAKVRTKN
ncbi:hypothetical protein CHUAL_006053 [Chamberlinius hualienensis]